MADLSLVGRCGLYCGACGIYRASKDNGNYLKKVAESFECAPELVKCEGCQNLTMDSWGNDCEIGKCLKEKGFLFCYECSDLENCERFKELYDGYKEMGMDLKENLERIKSGDAKNWVKEQEKKWTCSACNKPISCHMEECHQCGAPLLTE